MRAEHYWNVIEEQAVEIWHQALIVKPLGKKMTEVSVHCFASGIWAGDRDICIYWV